MKNKVLTYITLLSVLAFNSYAQKAGERKADRKYEEYAYIDAIKTYERVAKKGYKSADMFEKLGNAYYFNSNLDKAAEWYKELFAMDQEIAPEYYYRYSQSLKSIGKYKSADSLMVIFNKKNAEDLRGISFINNENYLEVIKANSGRYEIQDPGINSPYSDFGSTIVDNKLIFTSARDTGSFVQRRHAWTGQSFTDLYSADISPEGVASEPKLYSKKINSKFNESSPVFTKDGKTIYFSRNNYNGKIGKNENGITLVKIYRAKLVNDSWVVENDLSFNSDNYSVAHPALSPDEKTLYFASDMPGTLGQSDIFKVKINDDGTFGAPENLGKSVNTEGKETFPGFTDENELYFASDGHPGLGGLDIFVSRMNEDGTFNSPINVGAAVNSPQDDFGYLLDTKTRKGYFSSNRDGGQGYDDIYKFTETRRLIIKHELAGVVTDADTGEVLANAKVTVFDDKFNKITEVTTNAAGLYTTEVIAGKAYYVRVEKENYDTLEKKAIIPNQSGKTDLSFQIHKSICKVTVGDNLGVCFGIKTIYFDFDKWNITPLAAIELEKILDVMKEYPNMKIDVRSFTDSRGTFKYNEKLSNERAKSTVDWLVKNGANATNLTGKGYGETQLVNKCSDGVKCTEEEHQANRRSEFIITGM